MLVGPLEVDRSESSESGQFSASEAKNDKKWNNNENDEMNWQTASSMSQTTDRLWLDRVGQLEFPRLRQFFELLQIGTQAAQLGLNLDHRRMLLGHHVLCHVTHGLHQRLMGHNLRLQSLTHGIITDTIQYGTINCISVCPEDDG